MRALYGDADADAVGGWGQGLDPDAWMWVEGVDYAAGWRVARAAATEVNVLLTQCGVPVDELRAVAATDAQGHGEVRLVGLPQGWLRLEQLLRLASTVPVVESD
ncbi:hypothetical protein [Kitasatospora kifunensis]|uniref:Uncharacterized protein n=1 Tax=Kitasatospora kifunensis TaxID=58351 RepID=A0A7W7R0Y0_KITKI|nr:hypothetical protein [Kitasatospora kifunensis]MBB4923209.1 hypothetical protein [Kitasatospora kifunensis]